jgi:isopentenyl-diphosphate delta-isomerase
MTEHIYFVDENDNATGEISEKIAAHNADTRLHAAFSCYIFNEDGEFLITKRAVVKKVWPNVWTNSICGHPQPGEPRIVAIKRRLQYELGMTVKGIRLIVPDYIYKTPPYNGIIEHEFCPVYVAIATSEPILNPKEVDDYKWVTWKWFLEQTEKDSNDYTNPESKGAPVWSWWCKDQLKYIGSDPLHS